MIFLLLISLIGYVFLMYEFKIRTEFIPITFCSVIICVLYIAGLLNILTFSSYTIVFIGIFFCGLFVVKNFQSLPDIIMELIQPCTIFFIICTVACFFILKDSILLHYDNFSHWATVVKEIVLTNRLPNFESEIIVFKSYPPGSALHIYFLSLFAGYSEWKSLFFQSLLSISALSCLFPVKKDIKIIPLAIVSLFALPLLFSGQLFNLLVDTILPLVGLSGTIIIIRYKNDISKALILLMPNMLATLLIKNSGIFFVAFNCIFLLYFCIKNNNRKKLIYVLSGVLIVFFLFFLWSRHVDYVFPANQLSKHEMSISNYTNVVSEKSLKDIQKIAILFIKRLINIYETPSTLKFIFLNLIMIFTYILMQNNSHTKNILIKSFISGNLIFVIYALGTFLMYIFSMPLHEAETLASFNRYQLSILIYLTGYWAICIADTCSLRTTTKTSKFQSGTVLLLVIFYVYKTGFSDEILNKPSYEGSLVQEVDLLLEDSPDMSSSSVLVYTSSEDTGYLYYLMRYKTFALRVTVINTNDNEAISENNPYDFDYIVLMSSDDAIIQFVTEYHNFRMTKNENLYILK